MTKTKSMIKTRCFYISIKIVLIDSPWLLNGSNLLRGPALTHTSPKLNDFVQLQTSYLAENGLLSIWIIQSCDG